MIQVYGGYGSGKTFNVHLILNQIIKKMQQNDYKKWKYEEESQLFISSLSPSDMGLQFNGVRKIVKQLVKTYLERTKERSIQKRLSMGQDESDILDSILEISHESILLEFPGFQNPDKAMQKKFSNVVCQIMKLYTEENNETAPPIFCFDDFQYYDEGSLRVIKSLAKTTKRMLLIMLVRDRSLDNVVKAD